MSKKYSDEVRAQVMAALLKGQGVASVAREFSIPRSTVQLWRKQHDIPPGSEITANRIAELIATYLETSIETLTAQLEAFRDRDWLGKQDASELGVLHGVLMDKAIRILEATERADERRREEDQAGSNVVPISRTADGRAQQ